MQLYKDQDQDEHIGKLPPPFFVNYMAISSESSLRTIQMLIFSIISDHLL